MSFIKNTVYTKYGLNRLNSKLIRPETFNFTKVKIGDAKIMIKELDINVTDLVNPLYSFDITSITYTENKVTIVATIPKQIITYSIKEIGVFETIDDVDYLFALCVSDITKPSKLDYTLIVMLQLGTEITNFYPNKPSFLIADYTVAKYTDLNAFNNILPIVEAELQEQITRNTYKIENNYIDEAFESQKDLEYNSNNFLNVNDYLKNLVKNTGIINCYFNNFTETDYTLFDLSNNSNNLTISGNELTTDVNNTVLLDDSSIIELDISLVNLSNCILLGKYNSYLNKKYFKIYLENKSIKFTVYSSTGFLTLSYLIPRELEGDYTKSFNFFQFYVNLVSTEMSLKINNLPVETTLVNTNFTSIDVSSSDIALNNYDFIEETIKSEISHAKYKKVCIYSTSSQISRYLTIKEVDSSKVEAINNTLINRFAPDEDTSFNYLTVEELNDMTVEELENIFIYELLSEGEL